MSKNNRRAFITGSGAVLLNSRSISPSCLSSPQTHTATLTTDKAYDPSQIPSYSNKHDDIYQHIDEDKTIQERTEHQ